MTPQRLRNFTEEHIREDCAELTGQHENSLLYDCRFRKLSGLTLKDCDLCHSRFDTQSIKEALGFTMTLSCLSFNDVELSDTLFDALLALIMMTRGNDEKREKLRAVVGEKRMAALQRVLKGVE
jgi:hypothetical protein